MKHAESGFTLIEILIALVILGIALGVIMAGLANETREVSQATEQANALAIARSVLAATEALPLHYGLATGMAQDGYHWTTIISHWGTNEDIKSRGMAAYMVNIQVTNGSRAMTLSTLLAGPASNGN